MNGVRGGKGRLAEDLAAVAPGDPQPVRSFSRPLLGSCWGEAGRTQQGNCLLEPCGPNHIRAGGRHLPSAWACRLHGSLLPLPCRVLAEGSGRQ